MAQQHFNPGVDPTGAGGDTNRTANTKWEENFNELYASLLDPLGVAFAGDLASSKIRIVGGTIRQSSSNLNEWYWINDSAHVPTGVSVAPTSIEAHGGDLILTFAHQFKRVITAVATPDETLASRYGLSIGPSVNLDTMVLQASVTKSISGTVRCKTDGSWEHKISTLTGVVDGPAVSFSGVTLNVPHDTVLGGTANPPAISPFSNDADYYPRIPALRKSKSAVFSCNFFNSTFDGFHSPADARMGISYVKTFSGPVTFDGTGVGSELPFFNGNIWIFGIMELE